MEFLKFSLNLIDIFVKWSKRLFTGISLVLCAVYWRCSSIIAYNQQNDPRVGLLTRDATLINFLLPRNLSLCSVASQTFEVSDLFDEKLPLITAMVLMIPSVNLIVDPAV